MDGKKDERGGRRLLPRAWRVAEILQSLSIALVVLCGPSPCAFSPLCPSAPVVICSFHRSSPIHPAFTSSSQPNAHLILIFHEWKRGAFSQPFVLSTHNISAIFVQWRARPLLAGGQPSVGHPLYLRFHVALGHKASS